MKIFCNFKYIATDVFNITLFEADGQIPHS